jgi:hypothetical protein
MMKTLRRPSSGATAASAWSARTWSIWIAFFSAAMNWTSG